ncbi:MAG: EF-hand domain-containing protein, partial [Verrucomicrobiales bacterium]|nr:EF-hand domain-containing protein [Verrucomicrobiales bacterium]
QLQGHRLLDRRRPEAVPGFPHQIARSLKEGKVFNAYDKNDDSFVDDKEMEAMMEGKQNSRGRREIRKAIDRSDRDDDGKLNMREFIHWYTVGRLENGG